MERRNDGDKLIFLLSGPLAPHTCIHRLNAPFWRRQRVFSTQRWCLLSHLEYQSCSFWWMFCSCNYSVFPFITVPSLSCSHWCNPLCWNSTAHLLLSKGPQLPLPRFSVSLHSTPWKGCTCLLYPLNLISSQSLLWALDPTAPGNLLLMGYCDVRVHC